MYAAGAPSRLLLLLLFAAAAMLLLAVGSMCAGDAVDLLCLMSTDAGAAVSAAAGETAALVGDGRASGVAVAVAVMVEAAVVVDLLLLLLSLGSPFAASAVSVDGGAGRSSVVAMRSSAADDGGDDDDDVGVDSSIVARHFVDIVVAGKGRREHTHARSAGHGRWHRCDVFTG